MLRLPRRTEFASAKPAAELVARQQADRLADAELKLRQHQQRRAGLLEANAHLRPAYRQVMRELAWQRRAAGLAAEHHLPGYLCQELEPVPGSTRGPTGLAAGRRSHPGLPPQLPRHRPRPGARASAAPTGPAGRLAAGPHCRPARSRMAAHHQPPGADDSTPRPKRARSRPCSRAAGGSTTAWPGARRWLAAQGGQPCPGPTPPDPDHCWPSWETEQPGVSIRPLSHADLQALLGRLDHHGPKRAPAAEAGPAVASRG
jgi:hypothetical protein